MSVAWRRVVAVEMEQSEQAWVMHWMGEGREGGSKNDPQVSELCRGWRVAPFTETRNAGSRLSVRKWGEEAGTELCESLRNLSEDI